MKYNLSDISWVWFDLDDTLIDFQLNSKAALNRTYIEAGLSRWFSSAEQWIECYESHNYPLWDQLSRGEITTEYLRMERFRRPLADAGADDTEARRISSMLDPMYLDFLAQEKTLLPGAAEILCALRARGMRIGILSNGFADVQHRKIRRAGIDGLIDLTVLSDDIGVQKPDLRLYRHAMERSGESDSSRHLMIGDNPSTDIAGAIAAGWGAILLQPQHAWQHPRPVPEGATSAATLAEAAGMLGMKL
ncbi:MAG: YjjG family noncanonical pyrimidine nucleotidase [Muribaculaceae bacterium]|nr:YjjG family noncanonical pyrimidine nucleotidase [Muribaculaceae bacterium]